MGIVRGRKSSRISRIWKHSRMFSCTFYLGRNFYIWDCLNRESFLMNYSKEGNSRNFSSADDSRYTVPTPKSLQNHLTIHGKCHIKQLKSGKAIKFVKQSHTIYITPYHATSYHWCMNKSNFKKTAACNWHVLGLDS